MNSFGDEIIRLNTEVANLQAELAQKPTQVEIVNPVNESLKY